MNEIIKSLLENVQLVPVIAEKYTNLCCGEKINLDNQVAFRRIHKMLYYDATKMQTELVSTLRLLDRISVPYIFKDKFPIKVMWPQIVTSITLYEQDWENALMANINNLKVQGLLEQITLMPIELQRLIAFTEVDTN